MEFNFILNFIDAVFLQMDFFGMREGPLGSDDPMIKGAILSMLAVAGFGIALNVINSGIRKKWLIRLSKEESQKKLEHGKKREWLHLDQKIKQELLMQIKNLLT